MSEEQSVILGYGDYISAREIGGWAIDTNASQLCTIVTVEVNGCGQNHHQRSGLPLPTI
jgi:hypothetical protein